MTASSRAEARGMRAQPPAAAEEEAEDSDPEMDPDQLGPALPAPPERTRLTRGMQPAGARQPRGAPAAQAAAAKRARPSRDPQQQVLMIVGGVALIAGAVAVLLLIVRGLAASWQPVLSFLSAVPATATSSTATLTTTGSARASSVAFFTVETRGTALVSKVTEAMGKGPFVRNVGHGEFWDHDSHYRSKVELMRRFLKTELASRGSSSELVAFVDGADVIWGGCQMSQLRRAYDKIVRVSGARIVFGAEVVCGEQDCRKVPRIPAWASLKAGMNLNDGFWRHFVKGCLGTWDDACASQWQCGLQVKCADPPAVMFLNSGFFMGPIADVYNMVDWVLDNYHLSVYGDQSVFAAYWLAHKTLVTLDYLGELTVSLSDMHRNLLTADFQKGQVFNHAFGRVACFVHGNGRGITYLASLLEVLTGRHWEFSNSWDS